MGSTHNSTTKVSFSQFHLTSDPMVPTPQVGLSVGEAHGVQLL